MLKLKPTFYLYTNEINNQIKQSIITKYIEQLAQNVLTDIAEVPKQAENKQVKGEEVVENVC